MKFYTLTTVLLEETKTSVFGSFRDVVKAVNTILSEPEQNAFGPALQVTAFRFFENRISGSTIEGFLEILSEIGTPSETGFRFSDYMDMGPDAASGYVMVDCTVHEVELSDVGSLHFTNPVF